MKKPDTKVYDKNYFQFEKDWVEYCGALSPERVLEARISASNEWIRAGHPIPPGVTFDPPNALAVQHGGDHYKERKIQPIEYILANELGFCEGNVVKYVTRYKDKGGLEDLKKARHYIDFLIEDSTDDE